MSQDQKVHGTGNFVPGSVRIIDFDKNHNNLLVRGSSAFGAENFTMDTFVSTIQSAPNYASLQATCSPTPMIIDFCLIGFGPTNHKDQRIVTAEEKWFNSKATLVNGSRGPYPTCVASTDNTHVMVYWPILSIGGTVPTTEGGSWSTAAAVGPSLLPANNGFDFSGLVPAIRAALTNQTSSIPGFPSAVTSINNAVVYVHCDSGINRTGAAIISYLMQYGSNISVLGVNSSPAAPYHTLAAAQTAAKVNQPEGNTPVGGVDQGVAEAYCNILNTGSPTTDLPANCVPLQGSVN
ncbi:MAG: hypothetical protein ACJAS3_000031 [Roseivirga sp.]|jgi:hypothetical protein